MKSQVSQIAASPDSGSSNEDAWRRRLIDRLADVQVALWASEDSEDPPADGDPTNSTDASLTLEPKSVFLGLADDDANPDGDEDEDFATWDRIDEKRHLQDLARQFASDTTKRTRRATQIFIGSCVASIALVGWGCVAFFSSGQLSTAGFLETGNASVLTQANAIAATGGVERQQTRQIEAPPREPSSANSVRNPAADSIAALLSDSQQLDIVEERLREFVESSRTAVLMPVVDLIVSESGQAQFPLTLYAQDAVLSDAIVILKGLPASVVPTTGINLVEGTWQFKTAEMANQSLHVTATKNENFDLNFGVFRPDGSLICEGHSRIHLRRAARDQEAKPVANRSRAATPEGSTAAPAAGGDGGQVAKPTRPRSKAAPAPEHRASREPAQRIRTAQPEPVASRPMSLGAEPNYRKSAPRYQPRESQSSSTESKSIFKSQPHPSWAPFRVERSQ